LGSGIYDSRDLILYTYSTLRQQGYRLYLHMGYCNRRWSTTEFRRMHAGVACGRDGNQVLLEIVAGLAAKFHLFAVSKCNANRHLELPSAHHGKPTRCTNSTNLGSSRRLSKSGSTFRSSILLE